MSEDNGATWTMVEGTDGYDATDALAADPTNDNRVWYASVDGYGSITNGVLAEVPGGGNSPSNASDVAIAPDGSYCLVAGLNGRVYRSIGGDFTDLELISAGGGTNGNLPQSGIGRARVDIALTPNANGTHNAFAMYATSGGLFYGLFYSGGDGEGGTWEEVWPGEIQTATPLPRSQGIYDLALGISLSDPTSHTLEESKSGARDPSNRLNKRQRHTMRRGSTLGCTPTYTRSSSWTTTHLTAPCTWRQMAASTGPTTMDTATRRATAITM